MARIIETQRGIIHSSTAEEAKLRTRETELPESFLVSFRLVEKKGSGGTAGREDGRRRAMQPCARDVFSHQTGYPIKIPNDENKPSLLKIAGPATARSPLIPRAA